MADIFISYANEDREWVHKLATILEARGWSVWWDRNILAGQSFDEVIEHELEISKSIIVVWSKNSINSEWVKNEASVASEHNLLIPILIDHVKIPLEFRRKQTADLVNWNGSSSHEGLQMMLNGITTITKKAEEVIPQQESKLHLIDKRFLSHPLYLIIIGLIVVVLGLVIYILNISTLTNKTAYIDIKESSPIVKASSTEKSTINESEVTPILDSKIEPLKLSGKTVFLGVTAYVTRLENSGGLVTLEMTFKNMSSKTVKICAHDIEEHLYGTSPSYGARLIDELSGSSWEAKYYGGAINCSDKINLVKGGTHMVWIKYSIKNPDSMKLTLDWSILKRPLENLVIKNSE